MTTGQAVSQNQMKVIDHEVQQCLTDCLKTMAHAGIQLNLEASWPDGAESDACNRGVLSDLVQTAELAVLLLGLLQSLPTCPESFRWQDPFALQSSGVA